MKDKLDEVKPISEHDDSFETDTVSKLEDI